MSSLKNYLLSLNLFKPSSDSNQQEDERQRRWNIIATRIYIVVLILILFDIGLVLSLIGQTTMITIKSPIKEQFENLPVDAQCSCSHISLPYGKFTSLETTFHQVCSSDFVFNRWFEAISSGANSTYFYNRDFRTFGSAQFQALAGFCRLSKVNMEQSITLFYLNTLLTPQVLSEKIFRSQIQASMDQFKLTASNSFRIQVKLVNEMIRNNQLQSGLQTNNFFTYMIFSDNEYYVSSTTPKYEQEDGSLCNCAVNICNKIASGIYNIYGASTPIILGDIRWIIPGISAGCLPVNSLLVSTLECFYNQTCLNKLISYFPTNETFTAMTLVKQSRYSPDSSVQSIIDNLMIEEWMENTSYEKYYSECAPSLCTYFEISRHNFIYILSKLISLLAGLTMILELIIPVIIKFIAQLRYPTISPRIPFRVRLNQSKLALQKIIVELNIFKHYPSTGRQIRYQRNGTRLYLVSIFSLMGILSIYILLGRSVYSEIILNPTKSEYMSLQQKYPRSLSCPCTSISISHSSFITIEHQYHQLCLSNLISQQWIDYLVRSTAFQFPSHSWDFRHSGSGHFYLLTMFCQQAQQTIDDALQIFLETQFVSSHALSNQSLQVQVNLLVEDWKRTIVNTFTHTIQLMRKITQGNQLSNGLLNTNTFLNITSRRATSQARKYSNCSCALSSSCRINIDIAHVEEDVDIQINPYSIPNFFTGCYPIEALFASTLECFYNLSCMLEIHSYLFIEESFDFSALDANRNLPDETIEMIVYRLMVDKWLSNISFTSYYSICAPSSCTYQYERRNSFTFVITTIASIFGGLSLGLRLIILIGLQFIDKIIMSGFSHQILLHSIRRLFVCNTEQKIIRRLHFILVIMILSVVYIFSTFSPYKTIVEVKTPSLSDYKDLVAQSHDSLQCPCSQISIKYRSFLDIEPRYHEVCSSDFVSDRWISYLYGDTPPIFRYPSNDFYYSASGQFQLLASFCNLSQETVNNSLFELGARDFINTQLVPFDVFQDRIKVTINDFQLAMPNLFVNTLSLIHEMTKANMLMSVLSTNWIFDVPSIINSQWVAHTIPLDYDGCNCESSSKCVFKSRGMFAGCYPLEAVLQSTLQCLFDQRCIDSTNIFKAMNISSLKSSRFPINTTIESIVKKLMIEEFLTNITYPLYFEACASLSCTYSYVNNNNIIEGITTLIGIYGGLVVICHVLAIFIVEHLLCVRQRVTPITN